MTVAEVKGWQSVQDEVLRRINTRQWKPGEMIPNEADLSREFGCARATVNRALRALADAGLLERRRKAGTRVAMHPVRKATLKIPVIRNEIEGRGGTYRYALLLSESTAAPSDVCARMQLKDGTQLLHLVSVHLSDGKPYVLEDRWLNPQAVPQAAKADFATQSANEWLVANVPLQDGDITLFSMTAGADEARNLACREGDSLFVIERTTRSDEEAITYVRMMFPPGYRMHTKL